MQTVGKREPNAEVSNKMEILVSYRVRYGERLGGGNVGSNEYSGEAKRGRDQNHTPLQQRDRKSKEFALRWAGDQAFHASLLVASFLPPVIKTKEASCRTRLLHIWF
jgi:hypothetical protein